MSGLLGLVPKSSSWANVRPSPSASPSVASVVWVADRDSATAVCVAALAPAMAVWVAAMDSATAVWVAELAPAIAVWVAAKLSTCAVWVAARVAWAATASAVWVTNTTSAGVGVGPLSPAKSSLMSSPKKAKPAIADVPQHKSSAAMIAAGSAHFGRAERCSRLPVTAWVCSGAVVGTALTVKS